MTFFTEKLSAQTVSDSSKSAIDSAKVFNKINEISKKNKISKFIYSKLFKAPTAVTPVKKGKKGKKTKKKTNYEDLNCKIIRSINIRVFDPFGYDIRDTTKVPLSFVQKAGDKIHIQSTNLAIRNFLLFKKYGELDPYMVAETERLMRQSGIFRDIYIYGYCDKESPDSVDVYVRVIDRWSITGSFSINTSRSKINITDNNFLGLGHSFSNTVEYQNKNLGLQAYSGIYSINRIRNTFINAKIYNIERSDATIQKGIEVERPFYSPFTKWAGGINYGQTKLNEKWYLPDTIVQTLGIRNNIFDVYAARSFHLSRKDYDINRHQSTYQNLILSVRSASNRIRNQGSFGDSLGLYRSRDYLMGMFALSFIDYDKQTYILKFGEIEDVPIGKFYAIIGAVDHRNGSTYLGFRIGQAYMDPLGYFSYFIEGGRYYDYAYRDPSILNMEITYFTPKITWGKWQFRQFIKPRLTLGWKQTLNRALELNDDGGIQGFTSDKVYGMNRASLYLQTQAYAPWNILGFRFGPVLYFNCGMISDDRDKLFSSNFYSAVGAGIVIKNDLLILNSFQFSISFYPYIPGSDVKFKTNAFRSVDFNLRQLNIDRPEFVEYR